MNEARATAEAAAEGLKRSPREKGTARLAEALSDMPADSIAEQNNHLEHCRNKVAGWCMRDVLDFLYQRCATVEDYRCSASVCEMNAVDTRNRERVARFMAGMPEATFHPHTRHSHYINTVQDRHADRD